VRLIEYASSSIVASVRVPRCGGRQDHLHASAGIPNGVRRRLFQRFAGLPGNWLRPETTQMRYSSV